MNREGWWATVHGATKSQTQLSMHTYLTIPWTSIISPNILYDDFLYGISSLSQMTVNWFHQGRESTDFFFFFTWYLQHYSVHTAGAVRWTELDGIRVSLGFLFIQRPPRLGSFVLPLISVPQLSFLRDSHTDIFHKSPFLQASWLLQIDANKASDPSTSQWRRINRLFGFSFVPCYTLESPPQEYSFHVYLGLVSLLKEKAMAPHSSTLAWNIPWTEEPGGLQSMGSLRVGQDWATSLSLFTFMHWRRKWQPTPVFLPGESQGRGSLMGCCLWGRTESDTTEGT